MGTRGSTPARVMVLSLFLVPRLGAATEPQSWPLVVTLDDNSTGALGLGGGVLFQGPIYPGLRVGSEYTYRAGSLLRLFQSASVAYANGPIDRVGGLLTEFGAGLRVMGPLQLEGYLGAGLWWGEFRGDIYDRHGNPVKNGFWYLSPSIRLGLAAALPWWRKPDIVVGYEERLPLPLNAGLTLPYSTLFIGIRLPLLVAGGAP